MLESCYAVCVVMLGHSAVCHYALCNYVVCHYALCHYAECCYYAECRGPLKTIGLNSNEPLS